MIDPFTAFAVAQSAVSAIKKGIQLGRDIGGISNDLAKFAGALSDINFAHKRSENPPWYAVLFGGSGPSAMDIFAKKNKRRPCVLRLNNIFNSALANLRGMSFWPSKAGFARTARKLCIARRKYNRQFWSGLWAFWWWYQDLVSLAWAFIISAKSKGNGNGN